LKMPIQLLRFAAKSYWQRGKPCSTLRLPLSRNWGIKPTFPVAPKLA
jgi:hypothetical protein